MRTNTFDKINLSLSGMTSINFPESVHDSQISFHKINLEPQQSGHEENSAISTSITQYIWRKKNFVLWSFLKVSRLLGKCDKIIEFSPKKSLRSPSDEVYTLWFSTKSRWKNYWFYGKLGYLELNLGYILNFVGLLLRSRISTSFAVADVEFYWFLCFCRKS